VSGWSGFELGRCIYPDVRNVHCPISLDAGPVVPSVTLWPIDADVLQFVTAWASIEPSANAYSYLTNPNGQHIQHTWAGNFSDWHTMSVEWTPASLVFTLDDTTTQVIQNAEVPDFPCTLTLQQNANMCTQDSKGLPCVSNNSLQPVNFQIDWVVVYSYTPVVSPTYSALHGSPGLSSGAIAGIVIGSVVVLALIAAIIAFVIYRLQRQPSGPVRSPRSRTNFPIPPALAAPPVSASARHPVEQPAPTSV